MNSPGADTGAISIQNPSLQHQEALIHAYYAGRTIADEDKDGGGGQMVREVRFAIACGREYADNIALMLHRTRTEEPWQADLSGLRILELGPGINFGAALVLAGCGASVEVLDKYLVEWNEEYHADFYGRFLDQLEYDLPHFNWQALRAHISPELHKPDSSNGLIRCWKEDLSDESSALEDGAFDAVVSNAVLEHVSDIVTMSERLLRLTHPGGSGIHQVDFRDHSHPEAPLTFLTTPDEEYERIFREARGGGGNRARACQLKSAFEGAGFRITRCDINAQASPEHAAEVRARLSKRFTGLSDDELRVTGARFFLHRPGSFHFLTDPSSSDSAPQVKTVLVEGKPCAEAPIAASIEHADRGSASTSAFIGNEAAISVRALSKRYRIYDRPSSILKEVLLRRPFHRELWALRDVSFNVHRGEIMGVVGANGAGKSTLLRIMAGVLDASEGHIEVNGQLRAILQLGTGFHEEYTGRENIYMGGYCLGYTRMQIDESLEWIIDFSGLKHVIDQPFRTYSSGMKARLTFAVTFCRKPEVMIVDEALATGDIAFTQKCVNRILELCSGGATALVVSHSMYLIEMLCSRAIYLKNGLLVEDGPCRDVTRMYERHLLEEFKNERDMMIGVGAGNLSVSKIRAEHLALETQAARVKSDHESKPSCSMNGNGSAGTDDDSDDPDYPPLPPDIQALLDDPNEECPLILHLELVKLMRTRVLDREGRERDQFHTGEFVAIEFDLDSSVHKDDIAVGIQFYHETNILVATSTNLVHLSPDGKPQQVHLNLRRGKQTFRVEFERLFLSDGKYSISIGLSPKLKHFTEADQLMREKRAAAIGFYRDDTSWKTIYDPPSVWRKVVK